MIVRLFKIVETDVDACVVLVQSYPMCMIEKVAKLADRLSKRYNKHYYYEVEWALPQYMGA